MSSLSVVGPSSVYDVVDRQEQQFINVLSTDEINWQKERQFAIQILEGNDYLNKAAWGSQESLRNAIINVASIGISLNPASKHAYLVPRKNKGTGKTEVCLDISYMGLVHLAQKSGSIEWCQSKLVYENDTYVNTGVDTAPRHEQQTFGDKGKIIGVYCTVKLPGGDFLTEEMDIATLDKIRTSSKAANGPWKTWPEEMMRKCPVKRGYKMWPQTERMSAATRLLDTQDGNETSFNQERDITPVSAPLEQIAQEMKEYKQSSMDANALAWANLINQGKHSAAEIIQQIERKHTLTDEQKATIRNLGEQV